MAGRGLTPKQQRFVEEYLVDLNAAAAYRRAGYTAKGNSAETNAARLLRNAQVQAELTRLRSAQQERTEVTADRVVRELACLGFSDIGQVLDLTGETPRLRAPAEIPEAARRAIASVKVRRYTEGRGDDALEVEVIEFKFWDKNAALEKLGKRLAMWKDHVEHTGPDGGPIQIRAVEVVRDAPLQRDDA